MSLLNTNLRGVGDYRQALKDSLISHHLMDNYLCPCRLMESRWMA